MGTQVRQGEAPIQTQRTGMEEEEQEARREEMVTHQGGGPGRDRDKRGKRGQRDREKQRQGLGENRQADYETYWDGVKERDRER